MSEQAKNFLARHRVELDKIRYIVREGGKTVIYLDDDTTEDTFITMKAIMEELPPEGFLRVNKGYILPVSGIAEVVGGTYRMTDGRTFVGRVKGKGQHQKAAKAVAVRALMENETAGDVSQFTEGTTVLGGVRRGGIYDDLTGLLVNEAFTKAAVEAARTEKGKEGRFSVLCSDIDNFKYANERLGASECDLLLKQLASVLSATLPGYVMGGRMTGDGFCFLLCDATFDQVKSSLEAVSSWERDAGTSVSFGFARVDATLPIHGSISRAQMALKETKGVYGMRVAEYNDTMVSSTLLSLRIASDAEDALSTRQFRVYYQPKIDAATGKLCGAEALVRWHHPELGLISNADYIPLFEKSGFVPRLDEYVCHEVCRDLSRWIAMGIQPVPVSINLSRYDFRRDSLAEIIKALVDSYDIPHELLHFELTGATYLNEYRSAGRIVEKLKDFGFKIELDDFGTGYSSLTSLESLKLDIVKIDKALVDNALTQAGGRILESVILLAKSLGLQTVAEGVESRAQYDALAGYGCDILQGYYFSKPLQVSQYQEYLRNAR